MTRKTQPRGVSKGSSIHCHNSRYVNRFQRTPLDPLDWIHAITAQIPDRGQHLSRAYGHYSHRARGQRARLQEQDAASNDAETHQQPPAPPTRPGRASWARLMRRIMDFDPLLCSQCGTRITIISVLTDDEVVFKIARPVQQRQLLDEEPRAPPGG